MPLYDDNEMTGDEAIESGGHDGRVVGETHSSQEWDVYAKQNL